MSSRPSRGAARLAAILDALPDGLVLVNANGTVVNANTIALEMFETPGTALVGRGLLDLLPEFDSKLIPGSMRRPDAADARGRTKPTRMVARRTDGSEFPAEVTSASLEDGRDAYNDSHSYTGDELLMLVVRDLSGTMDTEAELARSQRQTEMILRAASEGVVGTDTEGRVVLVNPAAAQILGFRASDLGGHQLHPLILHSRADGEPFPYADSPLADTLRSGRKHRVRGQVLWAKNGKQVPVDLTTAPVRDGDQLVGAVMTFTDRRPLDELTKQHADELEEAAERHTAELTATTDRLTTELTETTDRLTTELAEAAEQHAAELADRSDRYAAEIEELTERYGELAGRHSQLTAVLGESLRGPLEELRGELGTLAADPAGQLWPEANQILHHLAAGYARMTTLVDNVLGYQRLDAGTEQLVKTNALLDGVVAAGVEGAIELIGPGRAQFAVHAPPIEAEVDAARLATALAHLVADVAGVDSTGRARLVPGGGYVDSTIVVAAAQRGDVVRIEVRGPFAGGDAVHEPIVRGIVRAHGGVLQTHEMPGLGGSAYVLELPLGEGAGTVPPPAPVSADPQPALPAQQQGPGTSGGGRRRARRASTDAFLEGPAEDAGEPTGRRRARAAGASAGSGASGTAAGVQGDSGASAATGALAASGASAASGAAGAVGTAGVVGAAGAVGGSAAEGPRDLIPSQDSGGTGRRRGRPSPAEDVSVGGAGMVPAAGPGTAPGAGAGVGVGAAVALPSAAPSEGSVVTAAEGARPTGRAALGQAVPPQGVPVDAAAGTGRRARHGGQRALPALPSGPTAPAPAPSPGPEAVPVAPAPAVGAGGAGGAATSSVPPASTAPATSPASPMHGAPLMPGAPSMPGAAVAPGSPAVPPVGRAPMPVPAQGPVPVQPSAPAPLPPVQQVPGQSIPAQQTVPAASGAQPAGRRARRALAPAQERHAPAESEGARSAFALPPAAADRAPAPVVPPQAAGVQDASFPGRHDAVRTAPDADHTPPQAHPLPAPSGRRRSTMDTPPPAPTWPESPVNAGGAGAGAVDGLTGSGTGAMPLDPNGWGNPPAAPGPAAPGQAAPGQAAPGQGADPVFNGPGMPTTSGFGMMTGPPGWPDDPRPAAGTDGYTDGYTGSDTGGMPPAQTPPTAPTGPTGPAGFTGPAGPAAPSAPGGPALPAAPAAQGAPGAPGAPGASGAPGEPALTDPRRGAHQPLPPALPLPEETPVSPDSTQGRAFSVRTLGQGVPFTPQPPASQGQHHPQGQHPNQAQHPHQGQGQGLGQPPSLGPVQPGGPGQVQGQGLGQGQGAGQSGQSLGSGRRRKLGTPPADADDRSEQNARPHPHAPSHLQAAPQPQGQQHPANPSGPSNAPAPSHQHQPQPGAPQGGSRLPSPHPEGRSYAIGAPDEGAEGPEPLDGPGGAVEVANRPQPRPVDDELPPEPLDNPRRLLVWPAPDVSTQQALSDRGYRPVVVHSREEVDAQIAAFPAALFVDPLTGPITRTALQSLRQAAVAAEVPVLVTAGLGQATREAAYGADPAVLLKALAPRDSEQHPSRVLVIEEHQEIALALTATLERRGMQVGRAATDDEAVALASQMRPNLVVMDLMQVRRRRAGIIDWLRANGQLNRTPLVIYTSAGIDPAELPRLASGETVLFLAERSTSTEVQSRIVELLAKIGTN
ncbi:PAS domain-containing protein [Streptomyces sp. NPDC002018]|uniref:PAS domain-containing protein n=1 Tax=Streptomyces sp. NPDC002018 TaxID=3364629 RepID=UPI003690F78D